MIIMNQNGELTREIRRQKSDLIGVNFGERNEISNNLLTENLAMFIHLSNFFSKAK